MFSFLTPFQYGFGRGNQGIQVQSGTVPNEQGRRWCVNYGVRISQRQEIHRPAQLILGHHSPLDGSLDCGVNRLPPAEALRPGLPFDEAMMLFVQTADLKGDLFRIRVYLELTATLQLLLGDFILFYFHGCPLSTVFTC
ncbi:hypothetical protein ES703_125613 [subsurface metagenome]